MIDEILALKKRCNVGDEIGLRCRLSVGEVACLTEIARHQTLTSKEVAALLDLSPSRGSRIVGGLMSRGFVQGEPDSHDRRYLDLSLTEAGKVCYKGLLEEKQRCEKRLLSQLSAEERDIVEQGLRILLEVI